MTDIVRDPVPFEWWRDAFTPGESARLAAFFDAFPTFQLLPDEQEPA